MFFLHLKDENFLAYLYSSGPKAIIAADDSSRQAKESKRNDEKSGRVYVFTHVKSCMLDAKDDDRRKFGGKNVHQQQKRGPVLFSLAMSGYSMLLQNLAFIHS